MKKHTIYIFIAMVCLINPYIYAQTPMSGDYTINPAGSGARNFASFNDAYQAMDINFISGPVTFYVSPGTYNEQLRMYWVNGSSATNLIKFTSLDGDSTNTVLQYNSSSSSDNYVLFFEFNHYVIFDRITLKALNSNYGQVIKFGELTHHITIQNCLLYSTSRATSNNCYPLFSDANDLKNIDINNNLIFGGYSGIKLYSSYSYSTYYDSNITIRNNTITRFNYAGLDLQSHTRMNINSNVIMDTLLANSNYAYGMHIADLRNPNQISKNRIYLKNSGRVQGIYMEEAHTALISLNTLISNNFISVGSLSSEAIGFWNLNTDYLSFINNSLLVFKGTYYSCAIHISEDPVGCVFYNNIFANSAGGYAVVVGADNPFFTSTNNDLYTSGSDLVRFQFNIYSTLAAYQSAEFKESKSVSANPFFVSNYDLHVNSGSLDSKGKYISYVTDDIDNETRAISYPDIGADEFSWPLTNIKYWTGLISSNWNDAGNWQPSGVPISTDLVYINLSPRNPQIGDETGNLPQNIAIDKIKINSGSSLIINPKSSFTVNSSLVNQAGTSGLVVKSSIYGTGNVLYDASEVPATVERFIKGITGGNTPCHFIGTPVSGALYNNVQSICGKDIYWYNETINSSQIDSGWQNVASGILDWGKGYAVYSRYLNGTIKFTGKISAKTLNLPVTYTYTPGTYSPSVDPMGWNLIGNPYPCGVNLNTFLTDNSSKFGTGFHAIYFWDDTDGDTDRAADYAVYNLIGSTAASSDPGNTPDGKLAVSQGCFIKVCDTATSVIFNTNQRVIDTNRQFFLPDLNHLKRFKLSLYNDNDLYSETLFGFAEGASIGFDPDYDAVKLFGNRKLAVYSILDEKDLSIQALPPIDSELVIPIGLIVGTSGKYYFKNQLMQNFTGSFSIFLEDKLADSLIDLTNQKIYSFISSAGEFKERFLLHFSFNAGNSISPKNHSSSPWFNAYYSQGKLFIDLENDKMNSINLNIYNASGQLILHKIIDNENIMSISINLNPGYYFASLLTEEGILTKEFLVTK